MRNLLLFSLLWALQVSAQERLYKFFTTKDGLPTNNIFKIRFDTKGFLWIAHDKGISRYDGVTFKNYSNQNQKSNVYTDIYIAPDGKVWMTNLGYQVYYIENDELKLYRSFELKYSPGVLKIAFLSNGNMVFNANGGLIEVNRQTGEETYTNLGVTINTFYQNKDALYFNSPLSNKLFCYKNHKLDSLGFSSEDAPIFKNDTLFLLSSNRSKEITVYNTIKNSFLADQKLFFNYNYSEKINSKFYVFTRNTVEEIALRKDSILINTVISGHSFTHSARDNSGNEWYSTLNEGILFVPSKNYINIELKNTKFTHLANFRKKVYGISISNILYDLDSDIPKRIGDVNAALRNEPSLIFKSLNDEKLIIGNSTFIYLDKTEKIHKYLNIMPIKDLCVDNKNRLYFAVTGGVFWHENSNSFFNYLENKNIENEFYSKLDITGRFNCVSYDSLYETLYFGGIPGFFSYTSDNPIKEVKYKGNSIYSTVVVYNSPYVIVGTIQTGIFVIKNGRIIKHIDNINNSIGNHIIKIINYKNISWILSNKGIHSLNLSNLHLQTYTNFGSIDLAQCTDFTIANNKIYILSNQNLSAIDMVEFTNSITAIPVYFNSINVGNNTIFDLNNLNFKYNENNLNINIDIPAANVLGNVEFEYKINQNNWHKLNKGQTEIQLSQLNPGNYIVSIRQRGFTKEYAISFKIASSFWNSWIFYFLTILFATGIVYYFYRSRVRSIRIKSSSEIEKVKLEKALQQNILSSIKSQMNPHFLFNALNTIQSYIYLNDKKLAIEYLGKFSVLTRKILDQSNHEYITLSEEYETLDLYLQLEKMRFENTLTYSISFENIPLREQYRIPPMMLQPYVENAVKHGLMHKTNNRNLEIRFSYIAEQELIRVDIDDNGIGRNRASEINKKRRHTHKPFSTEANKTRLEILNRDSENPIDIHIIDKTDQFGNATGTLVQINIPVL